MDFQSIFQVKNVYQRLESWNIINLKHSVIMELKNYNIF